MKVCPRCGSLLEGPTDRSAYYCSNLNCSVYGINYDKKGNVRRIREVGVSSLKFSKIPRLAYKSRW